MNYVIGISTSVFSKLNINLIDAMEKAFINGFNSIEIICSYPKLKPSLMDRDLRKKLRKLADALGIKILLHAPFYSVNIADYNREIRNFSVREIIDTITLGHDVEADTVTIHAGLCFLPCKLRFRETMKMLIDNLSIIVETAENLDIKLALEIRASNFDIGKPLELIFIIKEINSKYLGITFDTVQAQLIGDPIKIYSLVEKYCFNTHIRDSRKGMEEMLAIGEGDIDFHNLLTRMKISGFRGPFILEMNSLERAVKSRKEISKILSEDKTNSQLPLI